VIFLSAAHAGLSEAGMETQLWVPENCCERASMTVSSKEDDGKSSCF
jgi:hypothetical protein